MYFLSLHQVILGPEQRRYTPLDSVCTFQSRAGTTQLSNEAPVMKKLKSQVLDQDDTFTWKLVDSPGVLKTDQVVSSLEPS